MNYTIWLRNRLPTKDSEYSPEALSFAPNPLTLISIMLATEAIFRRTRYLGEYDFFYVLCTQYVRDRLSLQLINIHLTLNSD